MSEVPSRRLTLIGANGMLASMIKDIAPKNWELFLFDLPEFDITDSEQVTRTLVRVSPQIIINCAAYTNVDGCESQESLAAAVNGGGPGNLANVAFELNATLVHISTDYIFDGSKGAPYVEHDVPAPRSAYGRSKLAGEQAILASGIKKYFILRTSWLYGPKGKNFVETIIRLSREREELRVVADQVGTPTYTGDLASAIFNLLELETNQPASVPYGLYHFSNEGVCSWHEFAQEIVNQFKMLGETLKVKDVRAIRTEDYPLPAPRPAYSVFSKKKYLCATGAKIPHWRESLSLYLKNRQ